MLMRRNTDVPTVHGNVAGKIMGATQDDDRHSSPIFQKIFHNLSLDLIA